MADFQTRKNQQSIKLRSDIPGEMFEWRLLESVPVRAQFIAPFPKPEDGAQGAALVGVINHAPTGFADRSCATALENLRPQDLDSERAA
jgi:hypothetical protein